jgi:glycosyltransferase involved in cell wall biosynthesis
MNIIYLAPLVPARSGSGGKRAIYNHIVDLASDVSTMVRLFCVDVEGVGEEPKLPCSVDLMVLPRAFPRFRARPLFVRLFIATFQLFAGRLPRSAAVTASKQSAGLLQDALREGGQIDCVVVDHFFAAGLISQVPVIKAPVIYVAHNYETEICRDKYHAEKGWARKLIAGVELYKTAKAERRLVERSAAIITLTKRDQTRLGQLIGSRPSKVWPALSARKAQRWRHIGSKTLLFVGSAAYFPNEDAIRWLLNSLMPRIWDIDREVTLRLIGTAEADLLSIPSSPNVEFLGFVSDAQLERAYLESALFVCPVVLGSGIKIKVVEALSYGMPIALTEESSAGVEFAKAVQRFERDNADAVARNLVGLLSDSGRLESMSASIAQDYDEALVAKLPMQDLLKELIVEAAGDFPQRSA